MDAETLIDEVGEEQAIKIASRILRNNIKINVGDGAIDIGDLALELTLYEEENGRMCDVTDTKVFREAVENIYFENTDTFLEVTFTTN